MLQLTFVCRSLVLGRWANPGLYWSEPSGLSRPGEIAQSSRCGPSQSRTETCTGEVSLISSCLSMVQTILQLCDSSVYNNENLVMTVSLFVCLFQCSLFLTLRATETKHNLLFVSEAQCTPLSYPLLGNTAIARGSSKLLLTRTLRLVPSRRATSMVLRPVSVQYMFLATQSTASPSVVFRPWLITVSMPLPSRLARLKNKLMLDVVW